MRLSKKSKIIINKDHQPPETQYLFDKLRTINGENILEEYNKLIDHADVDVSANGGRVLSVEGFSGGITINGFAEIFLKNLPKMEINPTHLGKKRIIKDLQNRFDFDSLWERIKNLYEESEKLLSKSVCLTLFTWGSEFRPWCRSCAGDPQAIILGGDFGANRERLFTFTEKQYKQIFKDLKPSHQEWHGGGRNYWGPGKEKVKEYLDEQNRHYGIEQPQPMRMAR